MGKGEVIKPSRYAKPSLVLSYPSDSGQVPKYVFWTEDFPKTASGKIQKFKLQELGESLRKETPELLPVR